MFFDTDRRPFLLDSQMKWEVEPNAFLSRLSVVSGRTSSAKTWRSYAYQFADWLSFCERIGLEWRHATELNIATYRNILAAEVSPHTGRALRRSTINHKLGVICQFYSFAQRRGWINALPFDPEATRIPHRCQGNFNRQPKLEPGSLAGNSLRLREAKEELQIPPRREVRRFIKSFRSWRDQLIAEVLWVTGMRSAELCSLPLDALPENPGAIEKETVAIKITGKGQKQRAVLFPVRLLRSIERYRHMERSRRMGSSAEKAGQCVCGAGGKAATDIRDQSCVLDQLQTGRLAHLASSFEALLCRRAIGLPSGYWWPESAEGGANGTGTRAHGNHGKVPSSHRANAKRGARNTQ